MLSLHYVPGPVLNTLHKSTPFNSYKTHEGETIIIFIGMDKETEVSSFLCKFTVRMWESQDDYRKSFSTASLFKNFGFMRCNLDTVKIALLVVQFDKI